MKILTCEQRSAEWFSARAGLPTASNFDKIVDTEGKPSKQRKKYLLQLAGEVITGKSEETYQNAAMQRGIEMEAEARSTYEFIVGETVQEVGLCICDGYGASPDGFVGEDGLIEIKCPMMATHAGYLLAHELPNEYYQQVHGQLLVTGRKWCDFMSFYPGMRPLILRVEPDKAFQKALKVELEVFCAELDDIVNKIK